MDKRYAELVEQISSGEHDAAQKLVAENAGAHRQANHAKRVRLEQELARRDQEILRLQTEYASGRSAAEAEMQKVGSEEQIIGKSA